MPTSSRDTRSSLLADDRGAVMVMGIFMCSCLVGALWYLAGIGDAILYRERLQEAADAVAFSDAALHARGMNLLVLINLIMACVLGIRVALRTAKIVLTICSAVFAAASVFDPPLAAVAGATSSAAAVLQSVGSELDPAIDIALQGLNGAQDGIATATPSLAATAARESVGDLYKPTAAHTSTQELAGIGTPLPVEHVNPAVLCGHAATSITDITEWLLDQTPLGPVLAVPLPVIGGLMAELAKADPDGFCGLDSSGGGGGGNGGGGGGNGGGNNPKTGPAIDAQRDKNAVAICQNLDFDKIKEGFTKKEAEWLAECRTAGVTCQSRDPQTGEPLTSGTQSGRTALVRADKQDEQFVLDELLLERDQDLRTLQELTHHSPEFVLNPSKCIALEKADLKQRQAEQQQLLQRQPQRPAANQPSQQGQNNNQNNNNGQNNNSGSSSSGTTASEAVIGSWKNGVKEAQIIGGALGDDTVLQRSASLVRIGTVPKKTPQISAPDAAAIPAVAQAEFFYDCAGTWATCNADEDAMWNFRWRARLRRFNQPFDSTLVQFVPPLVTTPPRMGPDAFADKLAQEAIGNNSFDPNAALRHDLANSLNNDRTTHAQGVH
jgi:hypothetical protein